jgi:DNA ligase-associated metallophosphoesterase
MPASFALDLGGEALVALADRALHWPARGRLLLADLHLGKGDVFRRAGIAVPRGGTALDLARLDALLDATDARELWVLGDIVHGPLPDAGWREDWRRWRERRAALRVALVAGNHDRRLADGDLGLELLPASVADGALVLRHEPGRVQDAVVVCGHVHPVFAPPGLRRRFPGFWLREGQLVLPAFSAFTGGHRVDLAPGERGLLCVDGALVPMGGARGARG